MSLYNLIFGTDSKRFINKYKDTVTKINSLEKIFSNYKDKDFKEFSEGLKNRLNDGETLEDLLPDAFAAVREVAKRTLGLRHFDVQLFGGIALFNSNVAEMKTGEGKTLVATLPVYLHSLTGKNVHVITVNDYLARRDAVWMGQIYDMLGLTVGVINGENSSYTYDEGHKEVDENRDKEGGYKIFYEFLKPSTRKTAYACNITYGTNNEFAFDYLRDNTAHDKDRLAQRERYFALIDEVDSILIDEARQPLIISTSSGIPVSAYDEVRTLVSDFKKDIDYKIDEKQKSVSITQDGIKKIESKLNIPNLYVGGSEELIHRIENALRAKALYKKDREYVVRDNAIIIVDEFTGRLQPGRQWSNGLHQAICAKEKVAINEETRTYASVTFQNYFKLYEKIAGMTGTALSSLEEFLSVYALNVLEIPTNVSSNRIDNSDFIFLNLEGKHKAIVNTVKKLNEKGQPVLIGTISIRQNEELSKKLKQANIKHEVLNAKNHDREGEIISRAGEKNAVTIATNLAGRGVDIKLGGSLYNETKYNEVSKLGGLFILGTERNESRRVDNQLRGRSGRQGDVGETQFFISLEDNLIKIFGGSDAIKKITNSLGFSSDEPIKHKIINSSIENAQMRIEGHHFDSRKYALQYDNVLNKHRMGVYRKRKEILFAEDLIATYDEILTNLFDEGFAKTIITNLDEENINKLKLILLVSIDRCWINHLHSMEIARSSTGLRSYGQIDPMVEYKKEGRRLFSHFWDNVKNELSSQVKNTF